MLLSLLPLHLIVFYFTFSRSNLRIGLALAVTFAAIAGWAGAAYLELSLVTHLCTLVFNSGFAASLAAIRRKSNKEIERKILAERQHIVSEGISKAAKKP